MIRGDDDVFSIMDQMSRVDNTTSKEPQTSSVDDNHGTKQQQRISIRMVPEIEGYAAGEISIDSNQYCPDHGMDGNIWNPFVHVTLDLGGAATKSMNSTDCIPPTNPYVEVCRRRSYEKFKKKFYETFNWIAGNATKARKDSASAPKKQKSKTDDVNTHIDLGRLWENLPPHSVLERFYFACKINETFQVLSNRQGQESVLPMPSSADVGRIASLLSVEKDQGLVIDPILLSPFNIFRSSYQMLRNEIEFQFIREWKKAVKGSNTNNMKTMKDFFSSKSFQKRCTKICRAVNEISVEVSRDFIDDLKRKAGELSLSSSSSNSGHKRKGKKKTHVPKLSYEREQEKDPSGGVTESFSLMFSGLSFRISKKHFEKLQILFDRFNTDSTTLMEHQDSFYRALFTLLARYDLLEGAGLQSSINGNVFDVLLKHFDCRMECFASPFNSRYSRYCSAYPDTDRPFGSLGSFFNFDFKSIQGGGCFQANPPFASDFILSMCNRMETLLRDYGHENASDVPFMFVVFVPAWQDSQGWQALSKASSLVHHLFLSQKDDPHYYTEGTQHRRLKGRYRIASFDTSVFFLQNVAAKKKWPITEEMLCELKGAFGENPDDAKGSKKTTITVKKGDNDIVKSQKNTTGSVTAKEGADTKGKKRKRKERTKIIKGGGQREKAKKKRNLVADDGQSQLDILASLGIPAASDGASKTTTVAKLMKEKGGKNEKHKGKKHRKKR